MKDRFLWTYVPVHHDRSSEWQQGLKQSCSAAHNCFDEDMYAKDHPQGAWLEAADKQVHLGVSVSVVCFSGVPDRLSECVGAYQVAGHIV